VRSTRRTGGCAKHPLIVRPETSRLKGDLLWRQDAGATALAEALRSNGALQHLDLHACAIRCSGAAALAQTLLAGGGGPLASLNLRANYIGDAGATALAGAVRRSRGLRCLVTSSNDIGRAGQVRGNEIGALIRFRPGRMAWHPIPRTHGMALIPIPPTRPTTSGEQDRCAQETPDRWHSGKRRVPLFKTTNSRALQAELDAALAANPDVSGQASAGQHDGIVGEVCACQ
jgi:hypothetical protein